jgi:hypothetical protein
MPANWQLPTEASQYLDVLAQLKERDVDAITLGSGVLPLNPPENAVHLSNATSPTVQFYMYQLGVWVPKVIGVTGGGTGATSLDAFKASLGLGTMAYQNYNAVNITGGVIAGMTSVGTAGLGLEHPTIPFISWYVTNAGPDNKRWQLYADTTGAFILALLNDAWNVSTPIIHIIRNQMLSYSMKFTGFVGVNVMPNTNTNSIFQWSHGFASCVAPDGAFSSNLYVSDTWRHFQAGTGGMFRFVGATVDCWVAGAGTAGAPAGIVHLFTFNNVGTSVIDHPLRLSGAVTMGSTLNVASALTVGYTLDVGNFVNIAGDMQINGANARAGANLYLEQSNNIFPGIMFRGTGGIFAHLYTNTINYFSVRLTSGGIFEFGHLWFRPGGANYNLGDPSYRWSSGYALYWQSITGYGFIFDGVASRGVLRSGNGIEVTDDVRANFVLAGNYVLAAYHIATFASYVVLSTNFVPIADYAYRIGFNAPYRWYQAHIYHGVVTASADDETTVMGREPLGLRFINLLEPVVYRKKIGSPGLPNPIKHGLSGSRLRQVLDALDVDFGGLIDEGQGRFGLNYSELIAPIIQAIQDLDDKIEALATARGV